MDKQQLISDNVSVENNEITPLLKEYEAAVKKKDLDFMKFIHVSDVESFDVMLPFRYAGVDTLMGRVKSWFDSYSSSIDFKFNDIRIEVSGTLALCYALVRTAGRLKESENKVTEMWTRSTIALKRVEGSWKIFHAHTSSPIDMHTGQMVMKFEVDESAVPK